MVKRILLTGCAGFIGSNLAEKFLKSGYFVFGVYDFSSGQKRNIDLLSRYENFRFLKTKVEDLKISLLPSELSFIAHLASPASPADFDKIPEAIISVNTLGTQHLLKIAKHFGSRFLFTSTSEVYGDPLVHPQPETYWGNVNTQGVRSVYDESKRLGETYTALYHRKYGLDTRIVRIFNTYGPRMRLNDGRVVTNFIGAILNSKPVLIYGTGRQTRSFCYIDDLLAGLIEMLFKNGLAGQTINLGNDREISINRLVEIFESLAGRKLAKKYLPLPQPEDPQRRRPNLTKAKRMLNYSVKTDLATGLRKTIDYFKSEI